MCSTFYFSTTKGVTRKRLNVTFIRTLLVSLRSIVTASNPSTPVLIIQTRCVFCEVGTGCNIISRNVELLR